MAVMAMLRSLNNTYSQYLDGMPGQNMHVFVIYDDLFPRNFNVKP